jgi:hypothetical protein
MLRSISMMLLAIIAGGFGLSFVFVLALAAAARRAMPSPPVEQGHPAPESRDHPIETSRNPALA